MSDGLNLLATHTFPAADILTARFLASLGGVSPVQNGQVLADVVVLPLPIVTPPESLGMQNFAKGMTFSLQLQRISYVDEAAQQAGLDGASIWLPIVQATGLPQGDCLCPLLSAILTTPHQLETLLVGLGCSITPTKQEPASEPPKP